MSYLVFKRSSASGDFIYFSHDLRKQPYQGIIYIYGRKLLTVSYQPHKFGDLRSSDSRDILFLICHKSLRDQMFKGYVNICAEVPHLSHYLPMFGAHCYSAIAYITYLICDMFSQNYMSYVSWNFLSRY